MATISTFRGIAEISETTYWHLPAGGSGGFMFFNNAKVGRGLIHSVSYMAELDQNLANACTLYSHANASNEKEILFEEVRKSQFSDLPSRLKALYLFESIELAQRAQQEWFHNESRMPVRAWITRNSKAHVADANWLNSQKDDWLINANKYWSGEISSNPFVEVLVHGSIYLPDWKSFQISLTTNQ